MMQINDDDANKTHFYNKGFALSLVLKVKLFGIRKWPIESESFWNSEVAFFSISCSGAFT